MAKIGTSEGGVIFSLPSAGDLSSYQFRAVRIDSSGNIATATASNQMPLGGLLNKPSVAAEAAEILHSGIGKAKIGATIVEGDKLGAGSAGKLVKVVSNNSVFVAIALEEGVDGDVIDVLWVPAGFVGA